MTNIELDEKRSSIKANNAITSKLTTIDWEQRRYEIAKDVLAAVLNAKSYYPQEKEAAELAVIYADALIKELKNNA